MMPAGVTLTPDGVSIRIVSRHATAMWVVLFDADDHEIGRQQLARADAGSFAGFVSGVRAGQRYGLIADGPWQPEAGHRFDPSKLLLDPHATVIDRPFTYDPRLAMRGVPTAALVPKAVVAAPIPPLSRRAASKPDVIYELSVRSFTRRHPDVSEAARGTVAALAHPAVIGHLTELGVDTIELMPLTAAIDERHLHRLGLRNAWGYNPVSCHALDPRLCPGGIDELRRTVAALHDAGLSVILDVVLNHTGEGDADGPTLSLRGLDNALYYRHGADGALVNDTGCGNTLALDRPETMRLALDSLRHFVEAAGIDGFRYDLATVLGRHDTGFDPQGPLLTAIAADPVLAGLIHIAEPWDVGPGGYRLGEFPPPFLEWNDRYRDDVRRFWRGDPVGVGALATRLSGSSDIFQHSGRGPRASVNFLAAHDGLSLADCVAYADKHNESNGEDNRDGTSDNHSWNNGVEGPTDDADVLSRRAGDLRALLATLLLSRGTIMLTAGDEFGRTQRGNNNAYAQDNDVTWLDWIDRDRALAAHAGDLIRLRRRLGLSEADGWLTGTETPPDVSWLGPRGPMRDEDWHRPDEGILIARLTAPGGRVWTLALNRRAEPSRAGLPPATAARSILLGEDVRLEGDDVIIPPRSVVVIGEMNDG